MEYTVAVIVHVISVVVWIGGVAFVTMITFPMIQRADSSLEQVFMFQGVEHRFSKIAKVMVILVLLSGIFLMKEKYGFTFDNLGFGVWVMIFLWSVYASLLFGLEKIIFTKLFGKPSDTVDIKKVFNLLQGFHWVVLALSFLAIAAGIWTAHY